MAGMLDPDLTSCRPFHTYSATCLSSDIAVNSREEIYVTLGDQHCVQVYKQDRQLLRTLSTFSSRPRGIAIGSDDMVFISDVLNDRVMMYTREGHYVKSIGAPGTEPGQFNAPAGVAVDGQGSLYVCDRGNGRLQVF